LSANINGFKENGHRLIDNLLHRYTLCALQETKFADQFQYNTVHFHLDHIMGADSYYLATNDHRHTQVTLEPHRSSVVMMLFSKLTPGFNELNHEDLFLSH
jgi:hypothetical protein